MTPVRKQMLGESIQAGWPAALAGLAGLIVMIPIWLKPYAPYAYDSLHHLFTLFSLDQRIAAGDVYPLRFSGFAYGYGWAELSYYPPLSPYFLELLHLLGANYVVAYKLGLTLIVLGAALASYALGATLFNRYAGLVVAVAYVLTPTSCRISIPAAQSQRRWAWLWRRWSFSPSSAPRTPRAGEHTSRSAWRLPSWS